jgi:methionyl aminopeptidase
MISIKSNREIELMKIPCQIVAAALELMREAVKPGITTHELDRIADDFITKQGAEPAFKGVPCSVPGGIDFPATACISVNDEVIHGIPGNRVLKEGDIVSIDLGAYLGGFYADAARTFPVGKVSDKAAKLIEVTKQCFYEGAKNAVEGNRIVNISKAIQTYAESRGYSLVRDFVGHGIGRELWEEPQIPNFVTKIRGPAIRKGMTLAIEPMVNDGSHNIKILKNSWTVVTEDGGLSAHYENTVAVTDSEPIILTELS